MIVDRYQQHGLSSNPFAVPASLDQRGFFVDRGLPDPPSAASSTLVQVIGDKGAGKSTQILDWQQKTPGPYHYVPRRPYRNRWTQPPVEDLVYADEIDRMPVALRWRWFRQLSAAGATLVAGTHADLTAVARRAGLAVITHQLGPADLATVSAVLAGRLALASIGDGPVTFRLRDEDIADIHRRSRGSLRCAEVFAHQLVAERVHADVRSVSVRQPGSSRL